MPRFDVTTFGEGQLRYSVPAGHRLETADQFDVHPADSCGNVTSLLCRLGWSCGWVSALPKNPLGQRIANEFRLAGLDLGAVVWSDIQKVATYYVEYAVPPRSTQVYYDRANTCFSNLALEQIDFDYLLDTRLLHLSGLYMPLSPSVRAITLEAIRRARQKGVPVSFDMNFRRRLWTPEEARRTLQPLLQDVSVLFCGRSDAKAVLGIEGEPEAIVQQLGQLTPAGHIVTSLSSEGLIGWDRQRFHRQPAREVIILDRIGAGDAMVAGVLHGWLSGDFGLGLRCGALTAALALSQYGDQVLTSRQELEALLDSGSGDIVR